MPGFDVETPDGDSSNGPRFSRDISRNTRDLPSLLSSCFPITLKFMNVCYQLKIENTSQKKKNEDREQAKKAQFWFQKRKHSIKSLSLSFFFPAWSNLTLHRFSY